MAISTKTTIINGHGHSSSTGTTTLVAVAVKGSSSMGSRQAVSWAVDNLILIADRFVLVHVMPPINSIPTPSGDRIHSNEMDPSIVAMYRQEKKAKCEEIFLPFKTFCRAKEMETLVLEDENPAFALFKYITTSGCNDLVLGSSNSSNYRGRKLQGQDVPTTLMNFVTNTCNIFVVSRNKVISKLIDSYRPNPEKGEENSSFSRTGNHKYSVTINGQVSTIHPPVASEYGDYSEASVSEVLTDVPSRRLTNGDSFAGATVTYNQAMNRQMSRTNGKKYLLGSPMGKERHDFAASAFKESKKFELQSKLAVLQSELRHTLEMYERACEDLVHVEKKVQSVSAECVEEALKVRAAIEREEMWNKIAEEEKSKYLETTKELEVARQMLAQEVNERHKNHKGTDVLPEIKRFSNVASVQLQKADNLMPGHYICPILQEVMEDPHIAADGYTYEHSAIQKWVEKQKVSPVTRVMLPHIRLIPNLTLRDAIQEWKQQHLQRS
ncbi:hypothetical protein C5167_044842 [Papaver somniferum]|uniref:U-box domain-containing protein 34-like n=1 Tax=Papaver somniferum TaxID=3469 RepID=UPI000E6F60E9|nr:U-box domain-containing protein 34-like [Papaver somniferum]RZC90212.1 hypothetical protein C5167_044842 [Papaver somniferum]